MHHHGSNPHHQQSIHQLQVHVNVEMLDIILMRKCINYYYRCWHNLKHLSYMSMYSTDGSTSKSLSSLPYSTHYITNFCPKFNVENSECHCKFL